MKWTGTLGPRQAKTFERALRAVGIEAATHDEMSSYGASVLYSPFGEPDERRLAAEAALTDLGERHGWTVDAGSYKGIMAEIADLLAEVRATRPVIDTTRGIGAAERGRKTWQDETSLQRELERMGIEFYDGMPSVGVKVRFDPAGSETRRALADVPDGERHGLLERAWEDAQSGWWGQWGDENSEWAVALRKIFGKQATGGSAGRSAGHFVVQNANVWDFTNETDDGFAVIDKKKVDGWLALAGEIEASVKRPALDKLLALNVEGMLE